LYNTRLAGLYFLLFTPRLGGFFCGKIMEQDRSHIHEPGVETSRFRYRNHHPDGSPVVMESVTIEDIFSKLVGNPIPPSGLVYDQGNLNR
jgi:hypothetical protein